MYRGVFLLLATGASLSATGNSAAGAVHPTGRLHIEGVTLGMTVAEVSKALDQRGWVRPARALALEKEFGPSGAPTNFEQGAVGQLGFRGISLSYVGSATQARVTEVNLVMPMTTGGRNLTSVVPAIQKVFDEYVSLYGKPDACRPHTLQGLFRLCTWTRETNGAPETLYWTVGFSGPSLRLASGASPLR